MVPTVPTVPTVYYGPMPRREASANARCNRVELEGGGEVRSLVLRTQLGLKQHASRRAFEDAVVALNDLAAYPGDLSLIHI